MLMCPPMHIHSVVSMLLTHATSTGLWVDRETEPAQRGCPTQNLSMCNTGNKSLSLMNNIVVFTQHSKQTCVTLPLYQT